MAEVVNPVEARDVDDAGFDVLSFIADFRRYILLFGLVFIAIFALILVPLVTQAPKYTAEASVMIDPRIVNTTPGKEVVSDLPADTATIDTEVEILKSTALAERVMTGLDLDQDPEFNPYIGERKKFLGFIGDSQPIKKATTADEADARHQVIINKILKRVSVKRQGATRVINVRFTSLSPSKAAAVADAWARLYLLQQQEARVSTTRDASNWLDSRLTELRAQVETAERAVQQYKIANNLMSSEGATLTEQEISNLNTQMAGVKLDEAAAAARLSTAKRQLATGSSGDDVGEALNSGVVHSLRTQSAEVSRKVAELESRYGPRHPEILKAKREKEDIDQQIRAEITRIISNLEAQVQVQRQRRGALEQSVSQTRGTLAGNNRAQVRLNELERDAMAARTIYNSYLERFKETSSQEGNNRADARIVATAKRPTNPSEPRIPLSIALAFCGALGAATTVVMGRRALDRTITTSNEVELHLAQPYLAGLPLLNVSLDKAAAKMDPSTYLMEKPLSVFAEGFRTLKTSLIYGRNGERAQVIAVTSALPGEGKTTASICLAQVIAMAGQSVVVVDCDLRRKSLNKFIGHKVEQGLLEVLAGMATIDDVVVDGPGGKLKLLPLAQDTDTTKDVFGSLVMDYLIHRLRRRYDIVILDTAPVLPVVDTRVLARKADVVAMLVRWRKTPREAARSALQILIDSQAPLSGVALSQIDVHKQAKYAYGEGAFYYEEYKDYYMQ